MAFHLRTALAALFVLFQVWTVAAQNHWVDIWGTMPQLVEPANLPPAPFNATGVVFENATLRQTVFITQSASTIRLAISNVFGGSDLPITAVTVALPLNGSAGSSAIDTDSLVALTFSGSASYTIPNGARIVSDPIDFPVTAQQILTISIYLEQGQTTNSITGHPGSRTISFYSPGNVVSAEDVAADPATQNSAHWYFISAIEGYLPISISGALIIVGDSITDGRGSTNNLNDRWPDQLVRRLQATNTTNLTTRAAISLSGISVINEAAGGNRVLADGLGPNALSRIDRDVLAHSGLRYAMIYEGVNDIGTAATDAASQESVGTRLIAAYDQIVTLVHARSIPIFGATITPFSGPEQTYSDPNREAQRQRVNEWIRTSGRFDAVVDFDAVVSDPANATQLNPLYNSGDYLHLNPAGYVAMAGAVDLALFTRFSDGVSSLT